MKANRRHLPARSKEGSQDEKNFHGRRFARGSGSAGGVFGLLENTGAAFDFDGNGHNGEVFLVNINGGSARGGMMGSFKTDALTNVLTIGNIKPTVATSSLSGSDCSGGIIGKIVGNSAAYILIDGDANYNSETNPYPVSITVSGSANAGLVGDTGENGSFLDVKGKVKITGTCGAGFVSNMPQGVLRIQGKTDLSAFNDENDGSAYFVKTRGRALVYAKGTGSDGGWTLLRNLNNNCDDVGGWGQVLRTDGTILSESSLFTVDGSAHTITVKNAYTTVSDITQFALTSLNISLNTDEGIGALQFTSGSANSSATLLGGTLTLGADITLAGTGLTGFTRDDGRNAAFTRIFNGGSHTITLAIGEKYGLKADGTALDADGKQGNIYRHKYIGLFAKIDGAAVSNLTVSGSMVINQTDSGMRAGGFAAYATGSNTFVNLTADFTLKYKTGGNYDFRFGGAIGEASGTGFGATFTDCNITPTVADNTASSVGRPDNPNVAYIGGAIGYLSVGTGTSSPTQSVSVSGGTIGLYYTKSVNTKRESCFGGVIAKIGNAQYVKDKRTVSFADSAKIDVSATGIAAGGCFGGIFG
ncbi:MAG: hypothetical protein J6Y43_08010, partial [Clostridia bacterium]|nr:hypothetical protein [Clostridia bacterium]